MFVDIKRIETVNPPIIFPKSTEKIKNLSHANSVTKTKNNMCLPKARDLVLNEGLEFDEPGGSQFHQITIFGHFTDHLRWFY